jgi:hypothetical protein
LAIDAKADLRFCVLPVGSMNIRGPGLKRPGWFVDQPHDRAIVGVDSPSVSSSGASPSFSARTDEICAMGLGLPSL